MLNGKEAAALPESQFLDPSFHQRSGELVEMAESIELISSPLSKSAAERRCAEMKSFLDEVDTARVANVSPFNTIVDRINSAARKITGPVEAERLRISNMLKVYGRKENERARLDEVARQQEAKKLQEEAALLNDQLAVAQSHGDSAKVETFKLQRNQLQAKIGDIIPDESKAVGGFWNFELTGTPEEKQKTILDIANAHPDLVEMQIRPQPMRAYLKGIDGAVSIPGLKIFRDVKVRGKKE